MAKIESQKRHIAYKVSLSSLLEGEFVRGEGWDPSFVRIANLNVSRVDIIAVVISKPGEGSVSSFVVDDGRVQVICRSFEKNEQMENVSIGDLVHIIGRPRDYNNERYILPEIVRIIDDKAWIFVRQKEIAVLGMIYNISPAKNKRGFPSSPSISDNLYYDKSADAIVPAFSEEVIEESSSDVADVDGQSAIKEADRPDNPQGASTPQAILILIRQLDKGKGVDIDEIASVSGTKDCEQIVDYLLKEGEIFEIMPGRLKVLE